MTYSRRQVMNLAGAAAAAAALPRGAGAAQKWPARPITWVVPYPAGGTTDLVSRLMAERLTERLGQPVIIDNRPGGGTVIGTQVMLNQPADGYHLLFTASTHTINVSLQELPFNFLRDVTMVSGLTELPLVLQVNPKLPAKTLQEFIDYCKANPGKVNIGSFGATTISHLAIEFIKVTTGIDAVHVPFRGGAQMLTNLMSGEIEACVDALPNSLPHIKAGKSRALCLLAPKRSDVLPDVPAGQEIVKGLVVRTFSGVGVRSGTPDEIVQRLGREINSVLKDPAFQKRLSEVGAEPAMATPEEAAAFVKEQTAVWAEVIKKAGLKKIQ